MQGEKAVWTFCCAHWSGEQPLWWDHHPRGPFVPLPGCPWLEGSRLLQHRLPSLQETGLVFVILLALLPIEQQPAFYKTWSEARPLVFPPRKPLGLLGWSCWVPPLLARLWQHGTLPWDTLGTTWALCLGCPLPQPCGSDILADWLIHHHFWPWQNSH